MNQPPKTRKRLVIIIVILALLSICGLISRVLWQLQPDSAESLAFGEQQVEKMMADRPQMKRYIQKGDPIWQYCVRQFAGEAMGKRVTWNNAPLELGEHYKSESQSFDPTRPAFIRIQRYYMSGTKQGKERDGEELWASAFQSLNDMHYAKQYYRLFQEALAGKLDKSNWITANTQLTYQAYKDTLQQYQTLWEPQMRTKGIKTTPSLWWTDLPPTYEQWIALYKNPSGYPWDSWGKYYDEQIVPHLQRIEER